MIDYGWSPCQEGAKKTPLVRITPRVPGVPGALWHRRVGCWEETGNCGGWELPSVLVRAGLCTVLDGECQHDSG